MDNRDKEEKKMDSLKDPTENHSKEISNLIDRTIRNHHKVYLATDWHLYVRDEKDKPKCHKRNIFDKIIKNATETLTKDDVLIYLGDLCDGEMVNEKEEMKTILKAIPGTKILVLGNNDLFPASYYKSCGFEYVVQSFVWSNVLFTHIPCKNDNQINIHGHIHGYKTYWIPYTNQVDVAAFNGREELVELNKVIGAQKSYSKTIKECPEKFEEGYVAKPQQTEPYSIFGSFGNILEMGLAQPVQCITITYDPYPAED